MSRPSALLLRLTRAVLPPELARWGEAAAAEVEAIERSDARFRFALGCLGWAAGAALSFHLSRLQETADVSLDIKSITSSRALGLACAVAATLLGLLYLSLAGAPAAYSMINTAALAFGLVGLAILSLAERRGHLAAGPINLLFGVLLLGVALWGAQADGIQRWLNLGELVLQPSLVVLPLMLGLFARSPGWTGAAAMAVAALGLALQPDRAMAGVMTAALLALAALRPGPQTLLALAAAVASFVATLIIPDPSPAVPFVDRILYTAFEVSPLAGAAVLMGSALLIAPAVLSRRLEPTIVVFGVCWAAVVAAAALGNYPTPLVGYSGSAVVGYLLSLVVLPRRAERTSASADSTQAATVEAERPVLYAAP